MKDATRLKLIHAIYGSNKHEGMLDPYYFLYEVLYRYSFDEISKEEYFRLCEEYHTAIDYMEGKKHIPAIKQWATYQLKSPRAREMYQRWFVIKFPKLYKA